MRRICPLLVLALAITTARADSIPAYNMTSGSAVLSNINPGGFDTFFRLSNGNGMAIGGVDAGFSPGMSLVGSGQTGNPLLNIGFNLESSNVNGTTLFLLGSVTITGADFILPTSGSTFSTTMPVIFSGSFLSCIGSFGPFGGCNPPAPNYLGQFNINGTGMLSVSFISQPVGNGIVWELSSATYTLNAVPEPASLVLLGTGALAIFGKLRRRKKLTTTELSAVPNSLSR
jgi:hypothetical protein